MTASPCLPSATSSAFVDTLTVPDSLSRNQRPDVPELAALQNLCISDELQNQLGELFRRLTSKTIESEPSFVTESVLNKRSPVSQPEEHISPFFINLENLKFILENASSQTPSTHQPPFSNIFNGVPLIISTNIDTSHRRIPLSNDLVCSRNTEVAHNLLDHAVRNFDENAHTNLFGFSSQIQDETVSKFSSNLLQQLLSGADITQVRNRSGLIEPKLGNSPSKECTTTDLGEQITSTDNMTSSRSEVEPMDLTGMFDKSADSLVRISSTSLATPTVLTTQHTSNSTHPSSISLQIMEKILSLLTDGNENNHGSSHTTQAIPSVNGSLDTKSLCPMKIIEPCPLVSNSDSSTYSGFSNLSSNNNDVSPISRLTQQSPSKVKLSGDSSILSLSKSRNFGDLQPPCGKFTSNWSSNVTREVETSASSHIRPRSYSDLHNGTRYRHKLSRPHRPRSRSKAENNADNSHSILSVEKVPHEWDSSLFAQLLLNSEPVPVSPQTEKSRTQNSDSRSPFDIDSAYSTVSINERQSTRIMSSDLSLACLSATRSRILGWLREADLFVAEHCRDIPLGALLATSTGPNRGNLADLCSVLGNANSMETIPASARRIVSKCWHQLLLISLIENNFVPQSSLQNMSCTANSSNTQESRSQIRSPLHQKILTALSSLAALETDDSPPPDAHLVNELANLILAGNKLKLGPEMFKLIRFCVLAQNAHPHHFSTSYSEALSELESGLSQSSSAASFVDVLKLLNRLHCFDTGTLRQFFCLASGPYSDLIENIPKPSYPDSMNSTNCTSTFDLSSSGASKRKARSTRSTSGNYSDHDDSPIRLRSRAYTTNSYNKSARLSDRDRHVPITSRARSDTVPNRLQKEPLNPPVTK